jgi:ppGpp synthetase/RelA/SpoT-type nucleotidyltranferase
MDTSELKTKYLSIKPTLERLEEEVKFILWDSIQKAHIKTHSLFSRIKTLESINAKATRKSISAPLEEIEDIVGVRVVCLLRSDIQKLCRLIYERFSLVSEDNKLDGAAIDAFGYQSVHFVVQLPNSYTGPRYEGLHEFRLEIQIRTLAMDAWAALSHYLDYKNEADVPKDMRKDFFALSGLFYIADTHFELFYSEREKSKSVAKKIVKYDLIEYQELNLDVIYAYLKNRYSDRRLNSPADISELLNQLILAEYTSLDKLHHALESTAEIFTKYEKENPPSGRKETQFSAIGVVRLSLGIRDPNFAKIMKYSKNLAKYRKSFQASTKVASK